MLPLPGLAKSMEPWKSNYEGLVKGDTCGIPAYLTVASPNPNPPTCNGSGCCETTPVFVDGAG
jgi:hypothetical protein